MVKRKLKGVGAPGGKRAATNGLSRRSVDAAEDAEPDVLSDSGSDDEAGGPAAEDDGDDAFFETPDEKRVRLAKEYLGKLGDTRDEEEVREQLGHDVEEQAKRTRFQVSNLALGEMRLLTGQKRPVSCVCLSSDDKFVYAGGKTCQVSRYDVETGKRDPFPGGKNEFECGGHFDKVNGVCLIESRSLLVSAGVDRVVRLWDWRAPAYSRCTASLLGHQRAISAVVAEPDGSQVYSAGQDQSLRIWDLRTRKNFDTLLGHVSAVTGLDIYAKGRPVSSGVDKTVRLWKVEKDTHLMFSRHNYAVDAVCVVDQDRFVSGSQDGNVMLWGQTSKKPLATTSLGARQWITSLAAVRRGDVVFSGTATGSLRAWRLAKPEGATDKKGFEFVPALSAIQLPGIINQIAVGKRVLACALGKELKFGRWICEKSKKNGVAILPLSYSDEIGRAHV